MSDIDPDSASNGGVDAEVAKPSEEETPSSSNIEPQLAGSIEIDDDDEVNSSHSPRGEKRRHSHEENGGCEASKRLAIDDHSNDSLVDSTNDVENNINNKSKENDQMDYGGSEATPKEIDKKGENKSSAPALVIEISDDSSDSDICAVDSYQATADEVKRIRGDNYSSSSDYSSDSSSSCDEDDSIVLPARRVRGLGPRTQLEPRAQRSDLPIINKQVTNPDMTDKLSAHWAQSKDLEDESITLSCQPFKLCLLRNLLVNAEMINNIVDDMNTLDWTRKKMDLYEFHQTTDLANLTWQRSIRGIYDMLKDEVMPWVSKVTGLKLTSISASCSLYGPGDHLLVHDDLLSDRRVAFILYLAPWTLPRRDQRTEKGWCESMGGALELFSVDENGQPAETVKAVHPENNMLAFFQVSPISFHQVSEVLSLEFPRLSINGWFHGPGEQTDLEQTVFTPPETFRPHAEIVLMQTWLTPQYMTPRTRLQIQQQMEKASEISLQSFVTDERYQSVLQALSAPDIEWVRMGPANQRRYESLPPSAIEALPTDNALRQLVKLMTCANMHHFVHECSDLNIHTHTDVEVQRWTAHCYTVLPPKEVYGRNQLDAVMYLGLSAPLCGGVMTYVAPEEENAAPLISLQPTNNALNLIYKDAQTARFTKHVSARSLKPDQYFYMITVSYLEN